MTSFQIATALFDINFTYGAASFDYASLRSAQDANVR